MIITWNYTNYNMGPLGLNNYKESWTMETLGVVQVTVILRNFTDPDSPRQKVPIPRKTRDRRQNKRLERCHPDIRRGSG